MHAALHVVGGLECVNIIPRDHARYEVINNNASSKGESRYIDKMMWSFQCGLNDVIFATAGN